MSLEKALADNTEAIKSLETFLRSQAAGVTVTTGALPPKAAAEKEQTGKPVATAADTAKTTTPAATDPITYDQVKAAVNALAKAKGRDAVLAALGKFGLKNATEAKPEQWPELLAELNAQAVAPAALA